MDIDKRFYNYRSRLAKSQPLLHRSFVKYGVDKHVFSIVEECDFNDLFKLERYYGLFFKSMHEDGGLNLKLPSDGENKCICSKITRDKISRSNKGKKMTEETKAKLRLRKVPNLWNRKLVINKETGIFYESITEAAFAHGIPKNTLINKLNLTGNYVRNNTSICLV